MVVEAGGPAVAEEVVAALEADEAVSSVGAVQDVRVRRADRILDVLERLAIGAEAVLDVATNVASVPERTASRHTAARRRNARTAT